MVRQKQTVFVGLSGGVDSSVAAALLVERGFDVVGIHLKCFNVDGCAASDAEDARRAAETLGIPFYVLDFEKEYKERVVHYLVDGYRKGITPNPDVMCNREIKFGLFLEKALEMGADFVATGHYVRLRTSKQETIIRKTPREQKSPVTSHQLLVGLDPNKDQSYFLWTLTQQQLKYCLFPIGKYTKPQVRELAQKFGLPNADKKDSQGICFLGKVSLDEFLTRYIPEREGVAVNTSGEVIGTHRGAHLYTIGQRHLGILNLKSQISNRGEDTKPRYVAAKDVVANTVTLAANADDPVFYRREVSLDKVNFISPQVRHANKLENVGMSVLARVRYRQPLARANLKLVNFETYELSFDEPQKFIAPGQSAVFYSPSGEMLGGGVIL